MTALCNIQVKDFHLARTKWGHTCTIICRVCWATNSARPKPFPARAANLSINRIMIEARGSNYRGTVSVWTRHYLQQKCTCVSKVIRFEHGGSKVTWLKQYLNTICLLLEQFGATCSRVCVGFSFLFIYSQNSYYVLLSDLSLSVISLFLLIVIVLCNVSNSEHVIIIDIYFYCMLAGVE